MSLFESLHPLKEDPIFGLQAAFNKDLSKQKVNLGVGSYKDAEGKSLVLSAIRLAEERLLEKKLNKEYLPIEGYHPYIQESLNLVFGDSHPKILSGEIAGFQSIGATGALRVGAEFLSQQKLGPVYIADFTWPIHQMIFSYSRLKVETYPYYNFNKHCLALPELCAAIELMPAGSVMVMQVACQNPTGIVPTKEEWREISKLMKKQKVFPFFDFAYQGFGIDLEEDAWAIRHFVEEGHELFVASSYAKNMGIYGERAGLLAAVTRNAEIMRCMESHLKQIIRSLYSNPVAHTAYLVTEVLQTPQLKQDWIRQLNHMRDRVQEMRASLASGLMTRISHDFTFMNRQKGLFSFTGLSKDQVQQLRQDYAIYMPSSGRINLAGLNWHNLDYVIDAIVAVFNP